MKKPTLLIAVATMSLISGAWVAEALGQVSTTPTPGVGDKIKNTEKAQRPVSVPGIPAQFDLETRVEVLERQVAQLLQQVDRLTDKVNDHDDSLVGPSDRLNPINTGESASDSKYSGPRLKVPVDKKGD